MKINNMMDKLTIRDIDFCDKRVLVRVDYNVPLDIESGEITDDSRIKASIPTIDYLLQQGARLIICSHLGRPEGKVVKQMRLIKVADRLSEIMRQEVKYTPDCIGHEVEEAAAGLKSGEILMLENLRFHHEEEDDDEDFARALAGLADIYVNDAFGTSHRRHASIVGVTRYLPAVAGFLLEKEINSLGRVLSEPPRPFCVLLGGAKVSDKVAMLENIIDKVDTIIIGGGMAATFLKAKGYKVGVSLIEDGIETAARLIKKARSRRVKLVLPVDLLVAKEINKEASTKIVTISEIPDNWYIVDIGSLTLSNYICQLEKCRTVFWNGPMGIYEIEKFSEGTKVLAKMIANLHANTIIGGGSTAENVLDMKLADKMSFVSTGGGASLRFLSGKKLPGVEALTSLKEKVK